MRMLLAAYLDEDHFRGYLGVFHFLSVCGDGPITTSESYRDRSVGPPPELMDVFDK